jgi:hypothetical protein
MSQTQRQSVEARAEQGFRDEFEKVMEKLAAEQEQPIDTKQVTEPRKVALWGIQDPRVDRETFKQQLAQGFQPQDLQNMLIVQNHPELAEVYGQPVQDPAVAADLTELARYPFRLGTYHHIQDPEERTAEAERIHKAWLKLHGKGQDQATPEPSSDVTAPPTGQEGY